MNGFGCLFARIEATARPEGPKLEARRIKAGVGFLGKGAVSPLPTSQGVWGGAVNSPVRFGATLRPLLILAWFEARKLYLVTSFASRLGGGVSPLRPHVFATGDYKDV